MCTLCCAIAFYHASSDTAVTQIPFAVCRLVDPSSCARYHSGFTMPTVSTELLTFLWKSLGSMCQDTSPTMLFMNSHCLTRAVKRWQRMRRAMWAGTLRVDLPMSVGYGTSRACSTPGLCYLSLTRTSMARLQASSFTSRHALTYPF